MRSPVVKDDVRRPDPLPGQPRVRNVVVEERVPGQEDVIPLGYYLTVGGQHLVSLVHVLPANTH